MPPHSSCSTARFNAKNATVCRTKGFSPNARLGKCPRQKRTATRPCPPASLLDLHLALHMKRRVNTDNQIDFLGQSWHILQLNDQHHLIIILCASSGWSPIAAPPLNNWPEILGNYTL